MTASSQSWQNQLFLLNIFEHFFVVQILHHPQVGEASGRDGVGRRGHAALLLPGSVYGRTHRSGQLQQIPLRLLQVRSTSVDFSLVFW